MTDNVAIEQGYTVEVEAHSDEYDLYLLVKPNTFYDGLFKAWDTDEQEFLMVSGWLFVIHETVKP